MRANRPTVLYRGTCTGLEARHRYPLPLYWEYCSGGLSCHYNKAGAWMYRELRRVLAGWITWWTSGEGLTTALIPDHTSYGIIPAGSCITDPFSWRRVPTVCHMSCSNITQSCVVRESDLRRQSVAFTFPWLSWCPPWHRMKKSLLRERRVVFSKGKLLP